MQRHNRSSWQQEPGNNRSREVSSQVFAVYAHMNAFNPAKIQISNIVRLSSTRPYTFLLVCILFGFNIKYILSSFERCRLAQAVEVNVPLNPPYLVGPYVILWCRR